MRKETREIMTAFLHEIPARAARTSTDGRAVYLHGNKIAWRDAEGDVWATLAGWGTPTTRERLNGLCATFPAFSGFGFSQKDHEQKLVLPDGRTVPIDDTDEINLSAMRDEYLAGRI